MKRFALLVCAMLAGIALCHSAHALDLIFKDPQYSFQALRALSLAPGGGADIGECLKTLYRIKEGDDEGWHAQWSKTAEERERAGDEFLSRGKKVSARQEYLRASSYYRSAEFFLHKNPGDSRIVATWRKSRDAFLKFAKLAEHPVLPVEIPFEGTSLPGYYCLADASGEKRPLLILQTGFDGTAEELYMGVAVFALKRGYNCLIFEGPGQGRVIREQKIPFRPDWETVVSPVVNFALTRKEVEPGRIALMGVSFGGYFAPRAFAFEERIRACVANGGVYDFHAVMNLTPELEAALDSPEGMAEINREVYSRMEKSPSVRWVFGNGMFTFGAKSPAEWMKMTRPYNLRDVADKIRRPILVVDSEEDRDLPGQSRMLYEALKGPKQFMLFTREEGAGEHCQVGASILSNARILDWLDGIMKR